MGARGGLAAVARVCVRLRGLQCSQAALCGRDRGQGAAARRLRTYTRTAGAMPGGPNSQGRGRAGGGRGRGGGGGGRGGGGGGRGGSGGGGQRWWDPVWRAEKLKQMQGEVIYNRTFRGLLLFTSLPAFLF